MKPGALGLPRRLYKLTKKGLFEFKNTEKIKTTEN